MVGPGSLLRFSRLLLVQLLEALVVHALALRLAVSLRIEVLAFLISRLVCLDRRGVVVYIWVLTYAGDLPRHLHTCVTTRYLEAIALDLLCHIQVGTWCAYGSELVAEVTIEDFEVGG